MFRGLMCLLLSKHGYPAIPVGLESIDVTDAIYLPASLLSLNTDTQTLVQINKLIQNIFIRMNSAKIWLIAHSARDTI